MIAGVDTDLIVLGIWGLIFAVFEIGRAHV